MGQSVSTQARPSPFFCFHSTHSRISHRRVNNQSQNTHRARFSEQAIRRRDMLSRNVCTYCLVIAAGQIDLKHENRYAFQIY